MLECLVQMEDLGGIGYCFVEPNLRRREPKRADQGPALARSSGPRSVGAWTIVSEMCLVRRTVVASNVASTRTEGIHH